MIATQEFLDQFGDPGLSRIINLLRLAREEFESSMTSPAINRTRTEPRLETHCEGAAVTQSEETQ